MPEFVGPLSDDIAVLADDALVPEVSDSTPAQESELTQTSEATQADESATAATPSAPATEQAENYAWAKPILDNPAFADKFKAAQERLEEFQKTFGSVAGAREVKAILAQIGGPEKIKSIIEDSGAIDQIDSVAFGYNGYKEQVEYLKGVYERAEQQNPGWFVGMVKGAIDVIKSQRTPAEVREFFAPTVGQVLEENMAWEFLERLHALATQSGNQELANRLNQFAGVLSKYGIGPAEQADTPERARQRADFNADVGRYVESELETAITAQLQTLAPGLNGATAEISQRAHKAIRSAILGSPSLRLQLRNATRNGFTLRTAQRMAELMLRKVQSVLPNALSRAVREYEFAKRQSAAASRKQSKPASKKIDPNKIPLGKTEASRMSMKNILDSVRPVDVKASAVPRPEKLSKQDARNMSFRQIVDDEREVSSE